ncbi:hypothetical protein NDU88_007350 [Pleurodeles waltl]|uniref:Uncharacterized protein n=1 Tax=Pleurodeles waltl TaxID=8319 RepID=A0AAV7WIZ4_PLEWA|nr:hypothetical protein NDU88_007350 [Pleurodeles waltl]
MGVQSGPCAAREKQECFESLSWRLTHCMCDACTTVVYETGRTRVINASPANQRIVSQHALRPGDAHELHAREASQAHFLLLLTTFKERRPSQPRFPFEVDARTHCVWQGDFQATTLCGCCVPHKVRQNQSNESRAKPLAKSNKNRAKLCHATLCATEGAPLAKSNASRAKLCHATLCATEGAPHAKSNESRPKLWPGLNATLCATEGAPNAKSNASRAKLWPGLNASLCATRGVPHAKSNESRAKLWPGLNATLCATQGAPNAKSNESRAKLWPGLNATLCATQGAPNAKSNESRPNSGQGSMPRYVPHKVCQIQNLFRAWPRLNATLCATQGAPNGVQ